MRLTKFRMLYSDHRSCTSEITIVNNTLTMHKVHWLTTVLYTFTSYLGVFLLEQWYVEDIVPAYLRGYYSEHMAARTLMVQHCTKKKKKATSVMHAETKRRSRK